MYQVIVGDRHDTRYKAMMNNLMKSVFGFTFERWYARDLWNEGYECYSVVYDGRLISNVSMTKMTLLVAGHRVPAIQLGAVATLPEYRGLADNGAYTRQISGNTGLLVCQQERFGVLPEIWLRASDGGAALYAAPAPAARWYVFQAIHR